MLLKALLFAGLGLTLAASGAERVLWQIGKLDYSTLEFNQTWDFSARGDPKFSAGIGNAAKDWSAFHPGSADEASGSRDHPFSVVFELKTPPAGVYHLTINLLVKAVGIPQYVVAINGRKGRFLLSPQLSREIGDPETAWNILFSRQRLSVDIPASAFHAGVNQLVLTCVGGNYQPILGSGAKFSGHSGIYYDELELSNDPDAKWAPHSHVEATPTMFYRSAQSGLHESVVLRESSTDAIHKGTATLEIAGKNYSCDFDSTYDFGDVECAVEVPEFSSAASARLTFRSSAGVERADLTLTPARKWKLFLAPQMHLDMGYTDYRPDSYEVHARNIDEVVSTLEKHKDYKFNPDGAFIYSDYWEHRNQPPRDRVVALMKEGRLTLPAQLFTINTGLASPEELFRLFYSSAGFGRSHRLPILYADQTDVPAQSGPCRPT